MSDKNCGQLVLLGRCENDDLTLAKVLFCGTEWCPDCGEDWSESHQRKFSRLLPKFMQVQPGNMGYFVIEWPDRYRHDKRRVYSKIGLRNTTNVVTNVLAGQCKGRQGRVNGYFERGLLRWHYFGDLRAGKYNPHLNVIVEAGYIPKAKLNEIKSALRLALDCPDLIVHYHYRKSVGEMVHTLKYITRSTFKSQSWDRHMANEIFDFRNIRWWGKWGHIDKKTKLWVGPPMVWDSNGSEYYLGIAKLESGKCTKCGGSLEWSKPVSARYLDTWQADGKTKSLGGGYSEIAHGCYDGKHIKLEHMDVEITRDRERLLNGDKVRQERRIECHKRRVDYLAQLDAMGIMSSVKYQVINLEAKLKRAGIILNG